MITLFSVLETISMKMCVRYWSFIIDDDERRDDTFFKRVE